MLSASLSLSGLTFILQNERGYRLHETYQTSLISSSILQLEITIISKKVENRPVSLSKSLLQQVWKAAKGLTDIEHPEIRSIQSPKGLQKEDNLRINNIQKVSKHKRKESEICEIYWLFGQIICHQHKMSMFGGLFFCEQIYVKFI